MDYNKNNWNNHQDGITLEWRNLCYSIQTSRKSESQLILKNINGDAKPGEVVAILGGSGAGKTTLLNILAGRITSGEISGDIRCDNHKRDSHSWKRCIGYVEQDDIMDDSLTVHELLTYVALLKLPNTFTNHQKHDRVNQVINQMRLEDCKNTIIGDSIKRGLSGGERKRVHIAMELITAPMCIFFDEPTTGLDSFNAYHVIDAIRNLADQNGRTMIMAIHNPRKEILEKFDKIILLAKGHIVFTGNLKDAISYFEEFFNHPIPELTNPGDYFLDISTPDNSSEHNKKESHHRIKKLINHWKGNHDKDTKKKNKNHRNRESLLFPPFKSSPLPTSKSISRTDQGGIIQKFVRYCNRWKLLARKNFFRRDDHSWRTLIIQAVLSIFLYGIKHQLKIDLEFFFHFV